MLNIYHVSKEITVNGVFYSPATAGFRSAHRRNPAGRAHGFFAVNQATCELAPSTFTFFRWQRLYVDDFLTK